MTEKHATETPDPAPGTLEPARTPLSPPVLEASEATDWGEYAVLDVVTFHPATSRGFEGDRQRIEVYRYRERAPPVDHYENPSVRIGCSD